MSKGPIDPSSLSRRVLLPEVFHVARVFWYTAYGGIIDKLDEAGPGEREERYCSYYRVN